MRKKQRNFLYLFISVIAFVLLSLLIFFFPPSYTYDFFGIQLSIIPFFFILIIILLYSVTTFFLKSKKHGVLLAFFVGLYLLFRLWGLTHPFFFLLLLALFLTLELLFTSRNHQ